MVKNLVLLDKIYNIESQKEKKEILAKYLKYLREGVKGFPNTEINIKKLRDFDNRFEIIIDGPEEIFVYNLLRKEIGNIVNFDDIEIGKIYKGFLTDVGKVGFGLFVDCGFLNPNVDVFISLRSLRNQLCENKEISLRKIVKAYDLINRFPVYIKVLLIDRKKNEIRGELDQKTLNIFKKIIKENIEGLLVTGTSKGQFKKALIRKGHLRDIISIERFGFLEHLALFKEGTDAVGIISQIGPFLQNCKFSAIRSEKIKKFLT